MTHPHFHAESSVKLWGGKIDDYTLVHDWLDSTKSTFADFRHRAILHNSWGIFEAERHLGKTIVNADGRHVPVRYIAEQHVKEDCGGRIPSVSDWLSQMRPAPWMSRGYPTDMRLATIPATALAPTKSEAYQKFTLKLALLHPTDRGTQTFNALVAEARKLCGIDDQVE